MMSATLLDTLSTRSVMRKLSMKPPLMLRGRRWSAPSRRTLILLVTGGIDDGGQYSPGPIMPAERGREQSPTMH